MSWFHTAAFPPVCLLLFTTTSHVLLCLGNSWKFEYDCLSCWKLWCSCILVVCCGSCGQGEWRNLLEDVSRPFFVDCSPSARLLVCVADCGSLFHCLQTNLTQLAYVILLKISLYLANECLKPCFTSAFFGKFHEAKTSPEGLHIRGDSLNSVSN